MEGEEEEGEDILKEVLDEIGVDLNRRFLVQIPSRSVVVLADSSVCSYYPEALWLLSSTGMEGEEEEGEDILKEVLDEIGVDLNQAVCFPQTSSIASSIISCRWSMTSFSRSNSIAIRCSAGRFISI
jgi:hypothetical protein